MSAALTHVRHACVNFGCLPPGIQAAVLRTCDRQPSKPPLLGCQHVQRSGGLESLPCEAKAVQFISRAILICARPSLGIQPRLLLMYCQLRNPVPLVARPRGRLYLLLPAKEDCACSEGFAHLQAEKEAREGQIAKLTARLQEMELAQGHLAERNRLLETCLMINSPGSEQVCVCTA